MLPELVLTVLLVILLALTAKSTTEKGIKVYNKETKAKEVSSVRDSNSQAPVTLPHYTHPVSPNRTSYARPCRPLRRRSPSSPR